MIIILWLIHISFLKNSVLTVFLSRMLHHNCIQAFVTQKCWACTVRGGKAHTIDIYCCGTKKHPERWNSFKGDKSRRQAHYKILCSILYQMFRCFLHCYQPIPYPPQNKGLSQLCPIYPRLARAFCTAQNDQTVSTWGCYNTGRKKISIPREMFLASKCVHYSKCSRQWTKHLFPSEPQCVPHTMPALQKCPICLNESVGGTALFLITLFSKLELQ